MLAEFGPIVLDTIYYIAGWMIDAAKKAAPRQQNNICHCLIYFANTATISENESHATKFLLTGKVDRVIQFGGG